MIRRWLSPTLDVESLGLALLLALIAVPLVLGDWLGRWDRAVYDWYAPALAQGAPEDIVIVAIDERSIRALGRWPWPRRTHAALLDRLAAAKVRGVAFDVVVTDPDPTDAAGDRELAAAIARARPVVLPVGYAPVAHRGQLVEILPMPDLIEAAAALGHTDIELDPDGIARMVYLKAGVGEPHWSSLALALLKAVDADAGESLPGRRADRSAPSPPTAWVRDHRVMVPFIGPPGSFRHVSYVDVLQGRLPPAFLADRLALIGATVPGLGQPLPTPMSGSDRPMSGVEFNANLFHALRTDRVIVELAPGPRVAVTMGLVFVAITLLAVVPAGWAMPVAGASIGVTLLASFALLRGTQIWFAPVPAVALTAIGYPLWSWWQLRYAMTWMQRELAVLTREVRLLADPDRPQVEASIDFVGRVLPIGACALYDDHGRCRTRATPAVRRPIGAGTVQASAPREIAQIVAGRRWRLVVEWALAEPPKDAELALLGSLTARLIELTSRPRRRALRDLPSRIERVREVGAELHALQQFVADSLAQMADGVVVADGLGRVVLANEPARRYLGNRDRPDLEGTELIGLLDRLTFAEGGSWATAAHDVLLQGVTMRMSARAPDGHDLMVQMSPFRSGPGPAGGIIVNVADVTPLRAADHQRAARQLFDARERALVALHAVGDGVITTDADGRIDYLNPIAQRLTGCAPEHARGRPLDEVVKLIDERSRRPIELPTLESSRLQGVIKLPDPCLLVSRIGQEYVVRASVASIRSQDGSPAGTVFALEDLTEARKIARQMAYQATHDALTDLPNRSLLDDRLQRAIAHVRRSGQRLAVLCIDLDRFKTVNDGLGHGVGDGLLRAVAGRLRASVREADTVARLGGDEFVIVLETLRAADSAAVVANKVLAALEQPLVVEGHELVITASIGVSLFPQDGEGATALIKNADAAMYRAKEIGRANVQFYTQDMNARALDRLVMERDLRRALERRELRLVYQPQFDLGHGQVVGLEALLRWHHPDLGPLRPDMFVPLAEDTNLILPLEEWVINTACAQGEAWRRAGLPALRIAVNLSPRQFMRAPLAALVAEILARTGLDGANLEFEITERTLMQDVQRALENFRRLKAMGIGLAIDDFGTGYSSLNYLSRFPVDRLKIDRSFIGTVEDDANHAAIAAAIIAMARSLGIGTIAEGVESEAQLTFLRTRGCDEAQGNFLSPPLPPEQVPAAIQPRPAPIAL